MTGPRADGLVGSYDPTEVRTADDLATRRADEFLAIALLGHQVKAGDGMLVQPGLCTWCQQPCTARAVYCDPECRADHEAELATLAKQGRAR